MRSFASRFDPRLFALVISAVLAVVWFGFVGVAAAAPLVTTRPAGVMTERLRDFGSFERVRRDAPVFTATR